MTNYSPPLHRDTWPQNPLASAVLWEVDLETIFWYRVQNCCKPSQWHLVFPVHAFYCVSEWCPWIPLVSLWGAHRMCHTLCKCRRVQGWWYWRLRHKKHTFRCCNSLCDFFSLLQPNWTFSSVSIVMMKGIPPICPPSTLYCFHTCHLWHRCSHVIGCLWLCESCTGVTLEGSRSIFPTSLERSSEIPSREIESSGSSSLLKWIDDRGMSWNVAEKFSRQ